jgi:hypothetical protein
LVFGVGVELWRCGRVSECAVPNST